MKILKPGIPACITPDQKMPLCKDCLRNKKVHGFFTHFKLKIDSFYGVNCIGFMVK